MINQAIFYPIPVKCDYCHAPVIFTSNSDIYGKEFGSGKCYKCTQCDSYVGVHDGTQIPLGPLANKELRDLKIKCHVLFDPVWQNSKIINKEQAYGKLANLLKIPANECHFGWFDKALLLQSLEILNNKKWYIGVNWK